MQLSTIEVLTHAVAAIGGILMGGAAGAFLAWQMCRSTYSEALEMIESAAKPKGERNV